MVKVLGAMAAIFWSHYGAFSTTDQYENTYLLLF